MSVNRILSSVPPDYLYVRVFVVLGLRMVVFSCERNLLYVLSCACVCARLCACVCVFLFFLYAGPCALGCCLGSIGPEHCGARSPKAPSMACEDPIVLSNESLSGRLQQNMEKLIKLSSLCFLTGNLNILS